MAEPRSATIPAASITVNLAKLVRAGRDDNTVIEYQRLDKEGVELPRVSVFKKEGTSPVEYILADGDSRLEAWTRNGKKEIPVKVHDGSASDALLFAVSANADHGRPRSGADKRKAVQLLLDQPEHAKKSSRAIAELCGGISHHIVEAVRQEAKEAEEAKTEREAEKRGEPIQRKPEERSDKRGRKVKVKPRKKKNAILFDFHQIEKEIGHVVKSIDDVLEVYEAEKDRGDHRLVKQAAEKLFELWTAWAARISQVNK